MQEEFDAVHRSLEASSLTNRAGYVQYNVVAKKLTRRLAALGAQAMVEQGLGDDQHPHGYEAALDPWLAALWAAVRAAHPLPPGITEASIKLLT